MNRLSLGSAAQINSAYRSVLARGLRASGGRPFETIGVTKTIPIDLVSAGYQAGIRSFGENYADELLEKASSPLLANDEDPIRWHFIGAIQSRKIAKLARYVSVWHSVARAKEIDRIAESAPNAEIFIQVNFSGKGEGNRNGVPIDAAEELVNLGKASGLTVLGLMVVPPQVDQISLGDIFTAVNDERLRLGLQGCSMGMSQDFELALAKGSTHIRLGRVLFGDRSALGILESKEHLGQGGPG